MSDWVYEEEFGIRDGFRWSPDGAPYRLLAVRHDRRRHLPADQQHRLALSRAPSRSSTRRPAPPTPPCGRRGEHRAAGRRPGSRLPGDPREDYIAAHGVGRSATVVVQRMNRLQNHERPAPGERGHGRHAHRHRPRPPGLGRRGRRGPPGSKGNSEFLWPSERDGWRHVYPCRATAPATALVTPGSTRTSSDVLGVDETGGWLYYPPRRTTRPSIPLPDPPRRDRRRRARDARRAAGSHALRHLARRELGLPHVVRFDTPPVIELVSLPATRWCGPSPTTRAGGEGRGRSCSRRSSSSASTSAAAWTLDGWMLKPPDFDPDKKYPVLVARLRRAGGPDGARSLGRQHRALAPGARRRRATWWRAWTTAARRRRKGARLAQGRLRAGRRSSRRRSRPRPCGRSAARGPTWTPTASRSGAGAAAARSRCNAMFRYPDVYQVGMARRAGAGPAALRHDLPGALHGPAAGQRRGLPRRLADQLRRGAQGHLLIVHGSGDDNVHYQGTERLLNQLVVLDKRLTSWSTPTGPTHLRRQGHVAAHLFAADPVSHAEPAGRPALRGDAVREFLLSLRGGPTGPTKQSRAGLLRPQGGLAMTEMGSPFNRLGNSPRSR